MQLALKQLTELDSNRTDLNLDVMLTIPPGKSLVLENISWAGFEKLLTQMGNSRAARVAYSYGMLEIMSPLPRHEIYKEAIADLVKDFAYELNINYACLGSTTWKRQDVQSGIEPDSCFYIQNEPAIRGKIDLDLTQDPPPDLALEIDITSKSLNRMPIYARLGVPEVWRYDDGDLKIYHLQGQSYVEAETSLALPTFPVKEIIAFIDDHHPDGKLAMRRAFREWIKER